MTINIQAINFILDDNLKEYVNKKVEKLQQFHSRIENAGIRLFVENGPPNNNKVCEIRLSIPGNDIFAKFSGESFEMVATNCMDALEHQLTTLHH